jgi:hypothetical protein
MEILINIYFCKLMLVFKINSKTKAGMVQRECAYVSVLDVAGKFGRNHAGHILNILHILHIGHIYH